MNNIEDYIDESKMHLIDNYLVSEKIDSIKSFDNMNIKKIF